MQMSGSLPLPRRRKPLSVAPDRDRDHRMQTELITEFTPGGEATRAFRDALGRFATGVTVVTCATADGPQGITANSFSSVSLDPPLVLWSIARTSTRFAVFSVARHFVIHVLAEDERDLAARFTRGGAGFDGLDWTAGPGGAPVIGGTFARFDCRLHASHDGGDHLIIIGQVERAALRDGAPLVFSQGHFGAFAR